MVDESGRGSWGRIRLGVLGESDKSRGRVQTKVVDETGRESRVCPTESHDLLRSREASDLAADNSDRPVCAMTRECPAYRSLVMMQLMWP